MMRVRSKSSVRFRSYHDGYNGGSREAVTRRIGNTLRKPTTTPTKAALDLSME
jgi:hypothetical protein